MMGDGVLDIVKAFIDDNGNKNFTNKELIIFFNKQHQEDIKELKEILTTLSCSRHDARIVKLETTNKVIAGIMGIALIIFGLIIGFVK